MMRTPGATPSITALQIPTASSRTSKSVIKPIVLSALASCGVCARASGASPKMVEGEKQTVADKNRAARKKRLGKPVAFTNLLLHKKECIHHTEQDANKAGYEH